MPIYDVGVFAGEPYFSMKLVDGNSLSQRLDGKPIDGMLAARIIRDVVAGLVHAHGQGVIHRDLKPANILLTHDEQPLITDFGLAKLDNESELTRTGQLIGTPAYMPPEQATGDGERIDHRSDIYSVGAMLYACLTGRPPFQAATSMATVMAVLRNDPIVPQLLNSEVPLDLQTICMKCLNKEPASRYQSATELQAELDRFLNHQPILARPVSLLERTGKWVRRNPVGTGLIAATLLAVSALTATVIMRTYNQELETLLGDAETQRDIAKQERRRAREQADIADVERGKANDALAVAKVYEKSRDRAEYQSQIAKAQLAYQRKDFNTAHRLLMATRPEYRGWENKFLQQRLSKHSTEVDGTSKPGGIHFLNKSLDGKTLLVVRKPQRSKAVLQLCFNDLTSRKERGNGDIGKSWSFDVDGFWPGSSNAYFTGADNDRLMLSGRKFLGAGKRLRNGKDSQLRTLSIRVDHGKQEVVSIKPIDALNDLKVIAISRVAGIVVGRTRIGVPALEDDPDSFCLTRLAKPNESLSLDSDGKLIGGFFLGRWRVLLRGVLQSLAQHQLSPQVRD